MDPQPVVGKDDRPRPFRRRPHVDALETDLGLRQAAEDVAAPWTHELERGDGRVVRGLLEEDLGAVGEPARPGLAQDRVEGFPPRLERVLEAGDEPSHGGLHPLLGVSRQFRPRGLLEEPRVRPRVGELLQVGPRLKHADGQRERHEVEAAEEQRAAEILEELDHGRSLGVEEALVREGEASVGVGVRVEHGLFFFFFFGLVWSEEEVESFFCPFGKKKRWAKKKDGFNSLFASETGAISISESHVMQKLEFLDTQKG